MNAMFRFTCAALFLLGALAAGCARQSETQAETATSDSLFAANPSEPAAGTLTPEEQFQPQQPAPEEPPAPKPQRTRTSSPPPAPKPREAPGVRVPAGTEIHLTVDAELSSETAQEGSAWTGTVKNPVILGTDAPIPAGSKVHGVVTAVQPAAGKEVRAYLVLKVTSVEVMGRTHDLDASADTLWAASATGRNTAAIAGGAAAGALLGKVIGGSNKGAVIGGVLGGAAATGAVVKSKGYQSIVKAGQELTFSTNEAVVMRQ